MSVSCSMSIFLNTCCPPAEAVVHILSLSKNEIFHSSIIVLSNPLTLSILRNLSLFIDDVSMELPIYR